MNKNLTSWRVETAIKKEKLNASVREAIKNGATNPCNSCGDDHDPENCGRGFNNLEICN